LFNWDRLRNENVNTAYLKNLITARTPRTTNTTTTTTKTTTTTTTFVAVGDPFPGPVPGFRNILQAYMCVMSYNELIYIYSVGYPLPLIFSDNFFQNGWEFLVQI